MRFLEEELHNFDNILYYYSQVDSLTMPILEQLLKKNKLMRYNRDIYNLYFALTKKTPPRLRINERQKAEMYFELIQKLYKNIYQYNRKSFLSYNFVLCYSLMDLLILYDTDN